MIPMDDLFDKRLIPVVTSVNGVISAAAFSGGAFIASLVLPLGPFVEAGSVLLVGWLDVVAGFMSDLVQRVGNTGFVIVALAAGCLFLQFAVRGCIASARIIRRRIRSLRKGVTSRNFVSFRDYFRKGFFKRFSDRADLVFSRLFLRILMRLGELTRDYPWFDADFVRHAVWESARKLQHRAEPVYLWISSLFTRLSAGKTGETSSRLMDEGRILSGDGSLPGVVRQALSENTPIDCLLLDGEWEPVLAGAVNRWEKGLVSGLLIKGGCGSGKSSLLQWAAKRFGTGRSLIFSPLDDKESLILFIENILSAKISGISQWERRIVFVDDLESLMKRKIGGFDLLNSFCQAVERTKDCYLWVVCCNHVFFDFAVNFIPLKPIFHRVFEVGTLSPLQISEWCMKRYFQDSGISVRINPDGFLGKSADKKIRNKEISESEREVWLTEQYFRRLLDHGGFNFPFIRFSLLRSISAGKDGGFLLSLPEFIDIPLVKDLGLDDVFMLSSLLQHGRMTKEDLLEVLPGLSADKVSVSLSLFYENNLVVKEGDRFKINPVVYLPLIRYFQQRRMLG
jgi:hypothetical protein